MYYDEDFYYEPSEFEMQMDELKESLAKSIKSEFLEEMERLRKENKNLQGIKEQFEQVKRGYERKKRECDRAISEAEQKAKRMRIEELMEQYKILFWTTTYGYLYGPKCDKCDEHRDVEITLPSGKKVKDKCECAKNVIGIIRPQKMVLYELADRDGKITAWYTACGKKNERYYKIDHASNVYARRIIEPGTSFDEIEKIENQRELLFTTAEECQAYCDYINEKNGMTSDTIYKCDGSLYENEDDYEIL